MKNNNENRHDLIACHFGKETRQFVTAVALWDPSSSTSHTTRSLLSLGLNGTIALYPAIQRAKKKKKSRVKDRKMNLITGTIRKPSAALFPSR